MDYSEAYKYYKKLDDFIQYHYDIGNGLYIDHWEIDGDTVVFDCSYETDCDAACGYHYTTLEIPLSEVVSVMEDFDNKKADL